MDLFDAFRVFADKQPQTPCISNASRNGKIIVNVDFQHVSIQHGAKSLVRSVMNSPCSLHSLLNRNELHGIGNDVTIRILVADFYDGGSVLLERKSTQQVKSVC